MLSSSRKREELSNLKGSKFTSRHTRHLFFSRHPIKNAEYRVYFSINYYAME